ncbi:MAG: hypothetical protein FJY77_03930 [Candidatus Altiarchaeales archaeon]|nr:hypothetical protein [Candidatus Altiarchaeales archaeon]
MRLLFCLISIALLCGCITGPGTDSSTTTMPYEQAREIVSEAITKKDTTSCNALQEDVKKDWCYWTVALASKNAGICEQIQHTIYKAGCYMAVAISEKDFSMCDKIQFDDSNKIYATQKRCKAVISGDKTACDQLTGVQKDMCYLTLGAANKDMSQCNKVANKDSRDLCVMEVNAAV